MVLRKYFTMWVIAFFNKLLYIQNILYCVEQIFEYEYQHRLMFNFLICVCLMFNN